MSRANRTERYIGYVPRDEDEALEIVGPSDSEFLSRGEHLRLPPEIAAFVKQFVKPDSAGKRFELLDDAELGELAPPEWVIETVLPAKALAVIVAPPKSLKSFLVLDWAFHIASGMDWHGLRTKCGIVVYIYAEGTTGLQSRVAALKKYYGFTGAAGILFLPHSITINEPAEVQSLLSAIEAKSDLRPALIIIDTLARNITGDENSQEAMSAFVRGCDQLREATGATVAVVHHSGHTAEGRGRGSSVLPAAADTQIQCTRDGDRIQLECKFQKDAPEFGLLTLEAIPVAGSLVLKPTGVNSGNLTGNRLIALTTLHNQFGDEGAKYTTWRTETGLTNGPFSIALNWLKANAYVKQAAKRTYKATDAGRLALTPRSIGAPASLHSTSSSPLQNAGDYIVPAVEQSDDRSEIWLPEDAA